MARVHEREKGDPGEVARVLQLLSIMYQKWGDDQKARAHKVEADQAYDELIATGEYTREVSGQQKWDYLICLKFR